MWRWYCGGGVIAIAVVLGCATAVDFKDSGREAGAKKPEGPEKLSEASVKKIKRGVAAESGFEEMHNDGKPRMPIEASFDGDPAISITRDQDVIVAILPGADIKNVTGSITGLGGLKGSVSARLPVTEFFAGKSESVSVHLPALSGSLAVTVTGQVGGAWMSETLELQVNPKAVSAANAKQGSVSETQSRDMKPLQVDGTGQAIQPMTATQK